MHHDRVGVLLRLLDPERAKGWKFLSLDVSSLERKASGRDSIGLSLGDRAEVARSKEHCHLVIVIGSVNRGVQPKTGETKICIGWRRRGLSKIEQVRRIDDGPRPAIANLVNIDGVCEDKAAVKELNLEW